MRYWDGQQWTNNFQPVTGQPAQPQGAAAPPAINTNDIAAKFQDTFQDAVAPNRTTWQKIRGWAVMAAPAAAFLALISLAFPAIRVSDGANTESASFFAGSDGPILLILYLATIGFAMTAIMIQKKWATITAGAVGIAAAFFAFVASMNIFANTGSIFGIRASAGIGAHLTLILALILITASIMTLIPDTAGQKPTQPQQPYQAQ